MSEGVKLASSGKNTAVTNQCLMVGGRQPVIFLVWLQALQIIVPVTEVG